MSFDLIPVDGRYYKIEAYFLIDDQRARKAFMAYSEEEMDVIRTYLAQQDIYYTVEYLGDRV